MKGRAFVSHYLSSTSLSWHPEESSFTSRRSYYKQATQKHARKRRTTLGVIQHWFHTAKEPEIPHTLHIYNITILCCEILSCEPMNRVVSCISHPWSSFKRKCSGLNYVLQESMCWGTWVARLVGKNVGGGWREPHPGMSNGAGAWRMSAEREEVQRQNFLVGMTLDSNT